ncbi:hypothetical protein B7494_g3495 [Chlorociboria aeruginascens]|nr:hypothetical protein B7494_g3495 [Chlorociboria aeruginascens]
MAFSTMLKGRALDYYYSNGTMASLTFEQISFLINISDDEDASKNPIPKQTSNFMTLFGPLTPEQAVYATNLLVHRAFQYYFIGDDPPVLSLTSLFEPLWNTFNKNDELPLRNTFNKNDELPLRNTFHKNKEPLSNIFHKHSPSQSNIFHNGSTRRYDPCLLYTNDLGFGLAKDREMLTTEHPLKFNGELITLHTDYISFN